jgi:hypothetical protein
MIGTVPKTIFFESFPATRLTRSDYEFKSLRWRVTEMM